MHRDPRKNHFKNSQGEGSMFSDTPHHDNALRFLWYAHLRGLPDSGLRRTDSSQQCGLRYRIARIASSRPRCRRFLPPVCAKKTMPTHHRGLWPTNLLCYLQGERGMKTRMLHGLQRFQKHAVGSCRRQASSKRNSNQHLLLASLPRSLVSSEIFEERSKLHSRNFLTSLCSRHRIPSGGR